MIGAPADASADVSAVFRDHILWTHLPSRYGDVRSARQTDTHLFRLSSKSLLAVNQLPDVVHKQVDVRLILETPKGRV